MKVERVKGKKAFNVSVQVKNTGHVTAKETVQLYVGEKNVSKDNPVKELKGFDKAEIKPGQTKTFRFRLDEKAFAHFSNETMKWEVMSGDMVIYIGASSADIRCTKTVKI